jgi:peptidoglycan-associated lipoprotein
MISRRCMGMVASLSVLTVILTGCAKRPATMEAAAPAPGAGAGVARPAAVGVVDAQPSTPGTGSLAGPTLGTDGSAAAPTQGAVPSARPLPQEFAAVPDLRDIHFDFDQYDIRPGDARTLDTNAAWLKQNANMLVLIEGHCDERGTNEYNLALGERRAKAAMNYLVSQGVQASRITIISYGEERPVCAEKSEECWARNRRAHFLVKFR